MLIGKINKLIYAGTLQSIPWRERRISQRERSDIIFIFSNSFIPHDHTKLLNTKPVYIGLVNGTDVLTATV